MRIIIVSYYFPPLGLAGTSRPLALANYFASHGAQVFVVTVKPIAYPAYDSSRELAVDSRVCVVRVGSTDPARLEKIIPLLAIKNFFKKPAKKIARSMIFPDTKLGFVKYAVRAVRELLLENVETLLFTTSPPVSSHLVGLECANQSNTTWIADFRDIWTSLPPPQENRRMNLRAASLLRDIASKAALVTATSPHTCEIFTTSFGARDKTIFLPNGYSTADFKQEMSLNPRRIGFYGTLNDLVGIEPILKWLGKYSQSADSIDFGMRHVGHLDLPELKKILTNTRLEERFTSAGYLPYDQALSEIRTSAVNILSLSEDLDTSYVVPSKLWELLRAEPPIIAVLPAVNAARKIIEERRFPGVWIVDNESDFIRTIESILKSPDKYRSLRPAETLREFEWNSQFENLHRKMTEILA